MKDFSFLFPFPSTFPFPSSSLYYTLSSSTRAGASSARAASKSNDTDAAPISSFTWPPPTPTRTPLSQLPRTASKRPSLLSPSQSSSPLRFETRLIKASKKKKKKQCDSHAIESSREKTHPQRGLITVFAPTPFRSASRSLPHRWCLSGRRRWRSSRIVSRRRCTCRRASRHRTCSSETWPSGNWLSGGMNGTTAVCRNTATTTGAPRSERAWTRQGS